MGVDTSRYRYIDKAFSSNIAIQVALSYAADEQIAISVIIEISSSGADRITGSCQSYFRCDIRKMAIPVVPVKTVEKFSGGLLQTREVCAIGKEQVQPPVIVVVESRNAARHCRRQEFLRARPIFEDKIDAGGSTLILEPDRSGGSGHPKITRQNADAHQ